MHRPLILTTAGTDPERYFLRKEYITELESAGGTPLIVASSNTPSIKELCATMDGLCLTGGDDIHPSFFGEEIAPYYDGVLDLPRDQLERELIDHALKNNIPILGICRGMQALNVFLGGSLYQDITHERGDALNHKAQHEDRAFRSHPISIAKDSKLAAIMGGTDFMVNSIHHQAIKEVARGLTATATSPDGIIEAIELPGDLFVIGVEWHPEELADDASRNIFKHFIDRARERKQI